MQISKSQKRTRIHYRVRKKISGVDSKPRLAVYRSNKSIYVQAIDDVKGHTIAAASSKELNAVGKSKVEQSVEVGKLIASKLQALNILAVSFDRGGYLYHGRVKAIADGAREGGLQF
jgi:large subunit ribosomal protein L18